MLDYDTDNMVRSDAVNTEQNWCLAASYLATNSTLWKFELGNFLWSKNVFMRGIWAYGEDESADEKWDNGGDSSAHEPSDHEGLDGGRGWETEDQIGRVENRNVE